MMMTDFEEIKEKSIEEKSILENVKVRLEDALENARCVAERQNSKGNINIDSKFHQYNQLDLMTHFTNFAGNESYGTVTKGKLFKKIQSVFQTWQKRDCEVKDGHLYIGTGDNIRPPTKINILTIKVKKCSEEEFGIDVQAPQKCYKLKAIDKDDFDRWMNVLLNAHRKAIDDEFDEENEPVADDENIIKYIKNVPGNEKCCDCGAEEGVTWVSINLGILVCIQCSGFHRGKN